MARHYFIAVKLPNEIKNALAEWKETIEEAALFRSWVHKEDYHITLSFLGSAEETQLEKLKQDLQQLAKISRFSLTLQGCHTFGRKEQPRVFWVGVEEERALFDLQKQVYTICEQNGFQLETRPYHPHITIARKWKGEEKFDEKQLSVVPRRTFEVETVTLYETHVDQVPKYEAIHEISLQKTQA
ncbi:RNA 2',3'-cyclic phosphodiesterase [Bacillus sp. AFS018417]|uniref:RNA 2',3'-cyclic phosphodiesterase n=1 Tax=unclassified Bacillus (in: firmicutes) TaxID=185979 RepID=UPI000BF6C9D8|nr:MULTISPECIES: RNA 2',3'-cyclic phosphodiesterase [unclassified Bacillus (in: firmicutes)]MCP1125596.1 RNA 2',3'-cyclic phosphodiesterase [Bacillus sp. 3103sda1]PEZ08988.1 RNA 2',3'-cyclic phosphodiesterase [Bacillus sp. AFS018417]